MSYGQELNIDRAMVMKPVSVKLNGDVIKPKDVTDIQNGPRYRNRDRETMTDWGEN